MKLAVIIPYIEEWPQVVFTIRSIHEDLQNIDHEIIAVDNLCPQAYDQLQNIGRQIDRGHNRIETQGRTIVAPWEDLPEDQIRQRHQSAIEAQAAHLPWLTYMNYTERLSHWQCKRMACETSDAEIFLFVDAHVVPARGCLSRMYTYYSKKWRELDGSLHAPLTYHILEEHKLIYKLVYEKGLFGYSFTGYRDAETPYEVPVMSCCGVMIHKSFLEHIGQWPRGLGIWGGGENFFNAVMAVTGKKKWIMPGPALHHHGDKRGYHYEYLDFHKNRAIAMYLAGGVDAMWDYIEKIKDFDRYPLKYTAIGKEIVEESKVHRAIIEERQVTTMQEFAKKWASKNI